MLGIHQELASVYFSRGSARGDAGDEVRDEDHLVMNRWILQTNGVIFHMFGKFVR